MKKIKPIILWLFLSLVPIVLIILPQGDVSAQGESPSEDEINQIASQLYCPVCENVPLDECMTEACQQWRDLIGQQLAEGWTEQEIKDYFVAQYGDKVLGEPPRQGFNWILYLFPPLLILAAAGLLLAKFIRPRRASQSLDEKDPFLSRVERDLEDIN